MLVPVKEYKSKFITATLTQENGITYVNAKFDIDKLKKEYPSGLPNNVTTHIPLSFAYALLDEENPDAFESNIPSKVKSNDIPSREDA